VFVSVGNTKQAELIRSESFGLSSGQFGLSSSSMGVRSG